MRGFLLNGVFALLFFSVAACQTYTIKNDTKDGITTIEYTFFASHRTEEDALFSLQPIFRKTMRADGSEDLRMAFFAVGNAYMERAIEPRVLLKIDGDDHKATIDTLAYAGVASSGEEAIDSLDASIPYLHASGEVDLNPFKEVLAKASSIKIYFYRAEKTSIFVCQGKHVRNIRKWVSYNGKK